MVLAPTKELFGNSLVSNIKKLYNNPVTSNSMSFMIKATKIVTDKKESASAKNANITLDKILNSLSTAEFSDAKKNAKYEEIVSELNLVYKEMSDFINDITSYEQDDLETKKLISELTTASKKLSAIIDFITIGLQNFSLKEELKKATPYSFASIQDVEKVFA